MSFVICELKVLTDEFQFCKLTLVDTLLSMFFPDCRIAEYHLNHYELAHAAFTQGHKLDGEYCIFFPKVFIIHYLPSRHYC